MKAIFTVGLIYLFSCDSALIASRGDDAANATSDGDEGWLLNERPIIGVLAQEQSAYLQPKYNEKYTSYIAASYVKAIESAGARVVPIMIGRDRSYYKQLMSKINGVLLPGGSTYFNQSGGYADAGEHIYELAIAMNAAGDYFPVFGTCLGFELLIVLASDRKDERHRCYCFGNTPLQFTPDFRSSRMFQKLPKYYAHILQNEDVTVNAHHLCILDENLKSHNLSRDWRVMSHGCDREGVRFINTIEHKRYPFYGTQFHSEKAAFEWKTTKRYPHSHRAVLVNRYFMDFFVGECRRSAHAFPSAEEEAEHLIYNYQPQYTAVKGSAYEQCYMFESPPPPSAEINEVIKT